MSDIAALYALSGQALEQGMLVFLRVGVFIGLMPGIGEHSIPMRVKLAAAVALTLIVVPAVDFEARVASLEGFSWLILTETVAGGALGLGLRFFVIALQTAGSMAAQSMSLSQLFGQAGTEPMPGMSYVLVLAGITLALTMGLHIHAAEFVIRSYGFLPFGKLPSPGDLALWGSVRIAESFSLAFKLAAPFLIASALYNMALGVINRAMPQLMVAFVGAPLITAGGLILLWVASGPILMIWLHALEVFIDHPIGAHP